MPSNVVVTKNWHIQYLCDHMRPDEIENYLAVTGADCFRPDVCAIGLMNTQGLKLTVLDDKAMPIICGGVTPIIEGVYAMWMVGTTQSWDAHWRKITKCAKWLVNHVFTQGARRVEIESITTRTKAIEWYKKALGFECHGIRNNYGPNGEAVGIYGRVA